MMARRPWYKRYGGDFVLGTMSLSLEEKGAYSLCLDLIYDRGGPIPDDARWLAGVCGVSLRKWRSIRDRLIETGKLVEKDGHLMNARAGRELAERADEAEEHAENGAKGGRKRAENALKSTRNLDENAAKQERKVVENEADASENKDLAKAGLKPIQKPDIYNPPTPQGGTCDDPTFREAVAAYPKAGTATVSVEAMAEAWDEALATGAVSACGLLEAVKAFAAGSYAAEGGRPPRFDRWLRKQLWQMPPGFRPSAAPLDWSGPWGLLVSLRAEMGAHADAFLRLSRWDAERGAIVTTSPTAADRLKRDAGHVLRAEKVEIILEQAA